jgi:hypothetical protein
MSFFVNNGITVNSVPPLWIYVYTCMAPRLVLTDYMALLELKLASPAIDACRKAHRSPYIRYTVTA